MKNFLDEFKKFISRGNVMDMAVGIIIGGAFTAIVNSLVDDMVNPLLSLLTGGLDFSNLSIALGSGDGAATLNYGSFIAAIINFLLVALVVFWLIKAMNKVSDLAKNVTGSEETEEEAPTTKVCPYCKETIAIDATKCPHCTSDL